MQQPLKILIALSCLCLNIANASTLSLGRPIVAKTPGQIDWEDNYLEMFVNTDHQTALKSGENALYMVEEQRKVLIKYLEIAQKWQRTDIDPNLSESEIYQVCEGINSKGAFGLTKGGDGINYVVVVIADEDMNLHNGKRLFLTKRAVREVLLNLDSVPNTYVALKNRVDAIEQKRLQDMQNGQGGLRSTSAAKKRRYI